MPVFPSVEWFDAVRAVFNSDKVYRQAGGGTCDAYVGVKVGDKIYCLRFESFECTSAKEGTEADLNDVDFYMDMPYEDWVEMIANIRENGRADLDHTINTIDLSRPDGLAQTKTGDGYRLDFFFRYNQTFQNFFDASARIETVFAGPGVR